MKIGEQAYCLLRPLANRCASLFKGISKELKRSGIGYTVEEYAALFLLVLFLSLPLVGFFTFLFANLFLKNALLALIAALVALSFASLTTSLYFHIYPHHAIESKKRKIDNALHFATIYFSTFAASGTPPHVLFRVFGEFKEFGEIAKASKQVAYEAEAMGIDIVRALERAADRSPSLKFKDLLWGMRSIIVRGGNLSAYLREKSKSLLEDYRRKLGEYTRTVSLLLEVYITLVIVGSIFSLVLSSIIAAIGGYGEAIRLMQIAMIVGGLPFASIIFILVLKAISPVEV